MLRCQCPSVCDGSALWSRCMPGRGEGSSRAMLATARPSCLHIHKCKTCCHLASTKRKLCCYRLSSSAVLVRLFLLHISQYFRLHFSVLVEMLV